MSGAHMGGAEVIERPGAQPIYGETWKPRRRERRSWRGHQGSKRHAPARVMAKRKRLMQKAGRKANGRGGRHGKAA